MFVHFEEFVCFFMSGFQTTILLFTYNFQLHQAKDQVAIECRSSPKKFPSLGRNRYIHPLLCFVFLESRANGPHPRVGEMEVSLPRHRSLPRHGALILAFLHNFRWSGLSGSLKITASHFEKVRKR